MMEQTKAELTKKKKKTKAAGLNTGAGDRCFSADQEAIYEFR